MASLKAMVVTPADNEVNQLQALKLIAASLQKLVTIATKSVLLLFVDS